MKEEMRMGNNTNNLQKAGGNEYRNGKESNPVLSLLPSPQMIQKRQEQEGHVLWKELFLCPRGLGFRREAITNYHSKVHHVDAHRTLNDGVVVQMIVVPDDSGTFYDEIVSNDLVEHLENSVVELDPETEMQLDWGLVSDIQGD
ncbi:hypothetical protein A6R68_00760, partial [Neotoma lepida]